jgi:hypothetical protein
MIRLRVYVLVLVALILVGAALADAGAPRPCRRADDLLRSSELTSARTAYTAVLNDQSTERCASRGLDKVATAECDYASRLQGAGLDTQAAAAYVAGATALPPGSLAPCERIEARAGCAEAGRLTAAGVLAEARKHYLVALHETDGRLCAETGLDTVTRAECRQAHELAAGGLPSTAKTAYESIAAEEPATAAQACAVKALKKITAKKW